LGDPIQQNNATTTLQDSVSALPKDRFPSTMNEFVLSIPESTVKHTKGSLKATLKLAPFIPPIIGVGFLATKW